MDSIHLPLNGENNYIIITLIGPSTPNYIPLGRITTIRYHETQLDALKRMSLFLFQNLVFNLSI